MGQCKTCLIETEDVYYIFCSIDCQRIWYFSQEKNMGQKQYDIDKDLYTKWFEDKTNSIASLSLEEIEARVEELTRIEFFAKREGMMLAQQWDKLNGRKGLPSWVKDRGNLITNPNIEVNWGGEPRKKEPKPKKAKEDMVKNLLGFDLKELTQQLKKKSVDKEVEEDTSAIDLGGLSSILDSIEPTKPKEEKPKATDEEIKAKAAALKEKMKARLVK